MTRSGFDRGRIFTDAPELHPHWLIGSIQLLFWLFFHPSAWRAYVARIDPTLTPDFCLAHLDGRHWRNPHMRRMLLIGFVVWPFLSSLFIALLLWLSGEPRHAIVLGTAEGVAFTLSIGVAMSVAASVASGVATGLITGLAVGLATDMALEGMLLSLAVGIAFGLVESPRHQSVRYKLTQQIAGVMVGVLGSAVALAVAFGVVLSLAIHFVVFAIVESVILILLAVVRTRHWRWSEVYGVAYGVFIGALYGVWAAVFDEIAYNPADGAVFSILCLLPYVGVKQLVDPWAGAVAGALGGGAWLALFVGVYGAAPLWPTMPVGVLGIVLGLSVGWWRPIVLYPVITAWNVLLRRIDERRDGVRPSLLRWHSAFWDEHQRWRLFGLDEHVLLILERDPVEGQAALAYLANSNQRWAAQAVQIEMDARDLARCDDIQAIGAVHRHLAAGALAGPVSALLRSFSRISQDVAVALRQESAYNQRLALSTVEDRLDGLLRELTRSSETYAGRFRPIVAQWRRTVADHVIALADAVEQRQEIDNPYVIGVPLTAQQEIFVGRTDISARIEQLLLDRRRPPLLLYGQRRMGKTSLLNNLGRLLPSTIVPLFVDLQGPASYAKDYAGFLYNLARGMIASAEQQRGIQLAALHYETLVDDPFTRFDEWLDRIEKMLDPCTILLALDEFEVLDHAILKGRFDEQAILGMLRHLIQHRSRFKVLLAGSHALGEFQRWASYLINVQVVHISYLNEREARQLITHPVQDFALRYTPDAVARVLALTRGHPALVQLLCSEIVTLKNEQPPATRRLARLEDVAAAVSEALSHGSFFFADIQRNQVDDASGAVLRVLAAQGEGATVSTALLEQAVTFDVAPVLAHLMQLELIERVGDEYRFAVELIRRWFER